MQHHAAKDLLRHIEEPDLQRPTGSLTPALVYERQEGQCTKRALNENGEGAKQFALATILLRFIVVRNGRYSGFDRRDIGNWKIWSLNRIC